MGLFSRGPGKIRRGDKRVAEQDAKAAAKESAELRRQIAKNLMAPARATAGQVSANMRRIDTQLVHLEKLRAQVDTNRTQHSLISAETARLREQRRGLRAMQKAKKRGVRV